MMTYTALTLTSCAGGLDTRARPSVITAERTKVERQ
jgi:hypothetical protein